MSSASHGYRRLNVALTLKLVLISLLVSELMEKDMELFCVRTGDAVCGCGKG